MKFLIVPKPLFSSKMEVEGYYMASQYGNAILESTKSNPYDRAMESPLIEFMSAVGLGALTQDKPIFIPITQIQLATELQNGIRENPSKIVLLLGENILPDEMTLERCEHFKALGFKFAVVYKGSDSLVEPFAPYIGYVFIQVPTGKLIEASIRMKSIFGDGVTVVATDITDKAVFDNVSLHRMSRISLFDGPFYKVRIPTDGKQNALSPLKANYIQLLNIVGQDDFDYRNFTDTIMRDPGLTINFMKLVNSASKSRSEIKNFNQAAAMLGQKEIKKWVSTAVSNALCTDSPSEITRLSLIRAKFCENLAPHFEMAMVQDNLFLMGLFSVLDVVLDLPIDEAFKMVFVPPPVYNALVGKRGDYYSILFFVQQYELGHWKEISRIALVRNISIEAIHFAYKEAMLWYSELINMAVDESSLG